MDGTDFKSLKLKRIEFILHFQTEMKHWTACNRSTHIIGVQLLGEAVHDFGDRKCTLSAGCLYFLNQKDDFRVKVLQAPEALSVHFTTYEPIATDSFIIPLADAKEITALLERFVNKYQYANRNELKETEDFCHICAKFQEIREKTYTPKRPDITAAKEYMDCHFRERNCVEMAAALCRVSRRRFNDVFKAAFGETPCRYLLLKKLEYAKKLLEAENLTLAEIARQCGCSDAYYFCKIFKKEYAIPPGEYRHMIHSGKEITIER